MSNKDIWEYLNLCLPNKTIKRLSDTPLHGLRIVFTDDTYLDIEDIKTHDIKLTGFKHFKNGQLDPAWYHSNLRDKNA